MIEAGTGNSIPQQHSAVGPENSAVPVPAIETKSELQSDRPTTDEAARALGKMARKAAKEDYLDRAAYSHLSTFAWGASSVGLASMGIVNSITHSVDAVVPAAVALLAGGVFERGRSIYSMWRTRPKILEEGYAFQCIRAQYDCAGINSGEIVVALHPRQYPGERKEPAELATDRLKEALEVVKHVPEIDKIILPQSAVNAAGLPLYGSRPYDDTVSAIKQDPVISPYPKDERAVVLPKIIAADLVETLGSGDSIDPFASRVLSELAARHPAYREALTLKNGKLVNALHGILRTTLQAELPGSWRQRYDRDQEIQRAEIRNGEGEQIYAPGTAKLQDLRRPLLTEVDTSDPYNPRIRQRKTTYEVVLDQDLAGMTGGEKLFLGVIDRLNQGNCSDLELTSLALQLLGRKHQSEEGGEDATETPEDMDLGEAPCVIKSAGHERSTRMRKITRFAARTVMASSVLVAGLAAASAVAHWDPEYEYNQTEVVEPGIWRYEKHGMEVPELNEGYWTTDISYRWTPKEGWVSSLDTPGKKWHAVDMPTEIDEAASHVTIAAVTNEQLVLVPQHDGLGIVAVRVTEKDGRNVDRGVFVSDEGVVQVSPAIARGKMFTIAVDFGNSKGVNIVPNQPLSIQGGSEAISDVREIPRAVDGPTAQANDMSSRFTYDNSNKLKSHFEKVRSPREYVREVYEIGRCNCQECSQALAMTQAVAYPKHKMAYTTGFSHDPSGDKDHGYLSIEHAWLNVGGGVTDPQPMRYDAHSEKPIEKSVAELDRRWAEDQKRVGLFAQKDGDVQSLLVRKERKLPLKPLGWAVGSLAAAFVVDNEVRRRTIRNIVGRALTVDRWISAHQQLDVRQSFGLLGMVAYGRAGGVTVEAHKDLRVHAADPSGIPGDVLERAKRGELAKQLGLSRREAKGLKYAAAAELAYRRHSARRNATRKK